MYLTKLKLKGFRNYQSFDRRFSNQTIILVGPNTVGKTNLLEAIRFLSLFKSFRTTSAKHMIGWENNLARVEGVIKGHRANQKITGILVGNEQGLPVKRQVRVNGSRISTRKAVGGMLTVLFSPDDIQLITGSPSRRRRYLNIVLGQLSRRYYQAVSNYKRALEQRNTLLSSPDINSKELGSWTEQLAEEGGYLIKERSAFVEKLNKFLPKLYQKLSDGAEELELRYQPRLSQPGVEVLLSDNDIAGLLLKALKATEARDVHYQTTSVGPHRDDWEFLLSQRPLKSHGSRGEWRSAVLALKIGEQKCIEETTKRSPILLLDDVFSELDTNRRQALSEQITGRQTFITTTDIDTLSQELIESADIIKLN